VSGFSKARRLLALEEGRRLDFGELAVIGMDEIEKWLGRSTASL